MTMTSEVRFDELRGSLNGELLTDAVSRALYSTAACIYQIEPLAVVLPADEADVIATVQFADEHDVPVIARGSGSGLAGQAIGRGIIIDFTKYMSQVLEVNADENWVRVQPGLLFGNLNAELARSGKFFPPDPSSGNFCTLGGMLANNASGARSLKYGSTVDYVASVTAVLADGQKVVAREVAADDLSGLNEREKALCSQVATLLSENAELIAQKMPKVAKNSSGYLLNKALTEGRLHLGKLLAGSEGTLAIATEATFGIVDLPKVRVACFFYFDSLDKAVSAIATILKSAPSAVEMLDGSVLDLVKRGRRDLQHLIPDNAQAALLVEMDGDDRDMLEEAMRALQQTIRDDQQLAMSTLEAFDAKSQEALWEIRKCSLPILYGMEGPRRVTTFIEDVVVPADKVSEYVRGFHETAERHGISAAIIGHVGHGNFHTRPMLDLKDMDDVERLRQIADEVFGLATAMGGSVSGEHGDGLVRARYLEQQYGELVEVFREIKNLFDPKGIMNPGKILNDEDVLTRDLRFGPDYSVTDEPRSLGFEDGEYQDEIERCQGCGMCRTLLPATRMCPVYKALRDEAASPRGKVNLLRNIMAGKLDREACLAEFQKIAGLCLCCNMCELDCSAHVNVPKLMLEAKAWIEKNCGQSLTNRLLGKAEGLSKVNSLTSPLSNLALRSSVNRWLMEKATGIDRRRAMPPHRWRTFRQWLRKHRPAATERKVAYFVDLFANYNRPEIGIAMVNVLEHNGIGVMLPKQKSCGMPLISYGSTDEARKVAEYNVASLAKVARDGMPIVATEPTAALCLKREYLYYVDSEDARLVAQSSHDLFEFLLELHLKGELLTDFRELARTIGYHTPCHLLAQRIGRPAVEILKLIPGLHVEQINEGCCGIAGTFGFKEEGYDLSMQIGQKVFEKLKCEDIEAGVSDCTTCRMQLSEGTGKQMLHPIELLAEAYGV